MSADESVPLVSVLMATFNCRDTIDEALESLLEQTYEDWELILCDDASTDGTYERLLEFAASHPEQVTVIRNSVNSKLAYSLNRCLELATGEYVARMDGDDVSTPQRFERQVAYLEGHPQVDLVGSAIRRFSDTGLKDVVSLAPKPSRSALRHGVPFVHATIVAKRSTYEALDGYVVARRTERAEDHDLWFRFFAEGYTGHNLDDALYLVREDENALRRRNFTTRWNSYRTTLIGFRMLGYPARWYVRPTFGLLKAFVPVRAMSLYRRRQFHAHRKIAAAKREPGA